MSTAYIEMNVHYSMCSIVHNHVELYRTHSTKINYTAADRDGFIVECCQLANRYLVDKVNQLHIKRLVLIPNDTFDGNDFIQNECLHETIQRMTTILV